MPDIFDEVQEDLRAEAARRFARRYSAAGIGLLVLILAATGGVVWWQAQRRATADATASRYIAAARDADKSRPDAVAPLASIAAAGPEGYRTLARLRLAALDWQLGHKPAAIAAWQVVADDGSAPRLLRDLATLSRLQHQLDDGDPKILKPQAEALTAADNPWRPMAEHVVALLDLREGKAAEAYAIFKRLSADPTASPGLREMAGDLMQTVDVPPPAPSASPQTPPPTPAHGAAPHG